jgi:hypothetical protein
MRPCLNSSPRYLEAKPKFDISNNFSSFILIQLMLVLLLSDIIYVDNHKDQFFLVFELVHIFILGALV